MKRIAVILLCLLLAVGMATCSQEEKQESKPWQLESLTEEQIALLGTKTVILDAGHGFDDPGCQYPENGILEKELTLVLAKKIGASLEENGVNVLYTHDGETFLSLTELDALAKEQRYDLQAYLKELIYGHSGREDEEAAGTVAAFCAGLNEDTVFDSFERAYYANLLSVEKKADLFLSVHVNASKNTAARGFDLFACADTPYAAESGRLMDAIEASFGHAFSSRRCGTREHSWDEAYVVTKYADMPSVLLESGFATNAEDAKNLIDPRWQDAFSRAVADGIRLFLLKL